MKQRNIKTKGFNEIYFVLYLTALILIIPNSENEPEIEFEKLPSAFLRTEKSSLTIRLTIENGEPKVVSADTINYIYTVGNIKNVDYKVKISNSSIRKVLYEDGKNTNVPGFKLLEEGDNNLKFIWDVDDIQLQNRSYDVFVEAEVTSDDSNEKIYTNTRFNLQVLIIDNYPSQIAQAERDQSDTSDNFLQSPERLLYRNLPATERILPDIDFSIDSPILSLAMTRWRAKVRIFGLDLQTDLKGQKPIIDAIAPDGFDSDPKIENIEERMLEISGNTPPYGNLKIKLNITRKQDGREASTEFIVKPIPLAQPEFPRVVYPYITYQFDPKLPNEMGAQFEARLVIEGEIYAKVDGNSVIQFTPFPEDINSKLYFARYFKGELIGTKYPVKIEEYPKPKIETIKKENDKLRVFTKAYGFSNPEKHNIVDRLILSDSKLEVTDLTGFTEIRDEYVIQVFEISGDFNAEIKIEAQDRLGKISEPRRYP